MNETNFFKGVSLSASVTFAHLLIAFLLTFFCGYCRAVPIFNRSCSSIGLGVRGFIFDNRITIPDNENMPLFKWNFRNIYQEYSLIFPPDSAISSEEHPLMFSSHTFLHVSPVKKLHKSDSCIICNCVNKIISENVIHVII